METWVPYLQELGQNNIDRLYMLLETGSPLWIWYQARVNPRVGFRLARATLISANSWPIVNDRNVWHLDESITAFIERRFLSLEKTLLLLSRALMSNDYGEENDSRCLGYVYSRLSDGLDYALRARKIDGWHPGTANYIYLAMHAFNVGRKDGYCNG